jgi:glycosyltransferase involved in cell wall biosynthesis
MIRLSLLIPTLDERRHLFDRLRAELRHQIAAAALEGTVEVLHLRDDRQQSVGAKRNQLLERAQGEFVAFIDDDDEVSPDYLARIDRAIRERPTIDCVGNTGIIIFAGGERRRFVHSLRYREYATRDGVYCRPPYHLNPIRRSIARRYRFEEVDYSEDIDWAMRLCRDGALREEVFIDEPIYFYRSRRNWRYQQLIDRSEPVRHRLGLRLAERLRMRRWLRARLGRAT